MSVNTSPISLNNDQIIEEIDTFPTDPLGWKDQEPASTKSSSKKSKLEDSLQSLSQLIANITESFTTAIFVADPVEKKLYSLAHHSLSREYISDATISFGSGLVGWTAENKVRIAVCPFENDASTLLYYPCDQALKSFIAVPIISDDGALLGVIACDSKKSYAFAKITEKILSQCAEQAARLIRLHQSNEALSSTTTQTRDISQLELALDSIRKAKKESELFSAVSKISQSLLPRDALVTLVSSHEGFGDPIFYPKTAAAHVEHHLLDLVCKHKKIISKKKSIRVLPNDDITARSFLSVPFSVFGLEAGAINVLSAPHESYSELDIGNLEEIARVIGRELERIRAKHLAEIRQIGPSLLPWNHFCVQADAALQNESTPLAAARASFQNLSGLETEIGVEHLALLHEQLIRICQQVCGGHVLASAPYGTAIYLFGTSEEIDTCSQRITRFLSKFASDLTSHHANKISTHLQIQVFPHTQGCASVEQMLKASKMPTQSSPQLSKAPIASSHTQAKESDFILGEATSTKGDSRYARFW